MRLVAIKEPSKSWSTRYYNVWNVSAISVPFRLFRLILTEYLQINVLILFHSTKSLEVCESSQAQESSFTNAKNKLKKLI